VQAQSTGPEGKRKLLDALIERLLLVEDAAEQVTDVKRKEDIQHARSDLLARLLHQEEVDEKVKLSDAEVRAKYERNKAHSADPPRVKVRYIRVSRGLTRDEDRKARARVEEAVAKLRLGGLLGQGAQPADFAAIARQYSDDADTAASGELDRWIGESGNPLAELFEHALHGELLPLKVGDLSPILPIDDSYDLFQIREKQEARQRPFEEAQDLVRRRLETRKHEELTRQMERDLLERMQLQIYNRRIQTMLDELGGTAAGRR
jgi:parvulin-like peptidyl-prolyl isomerase